MNKYIIYLRKSTDREDKQVLSLDSQREEMNIIVKRDGLCIIKTFEESHSAKAPGRPVFNEMIETIEKGEANSILTWGINRLSRNSIDTGKIIYLLDQDKLMEIKVPSLTFSNTPENKYMLAMFGSQAKLENDSKGRDVKRGLKSKAEKGWFPGHTPIGYIHEPNKVKGYTKIINDPERYDSIKRLWELMFTGKYNPIQLLEIANNKLMIRTRRGNPIARSTIYKILKNPFYCGEFYYPQKLQKLYHGGHNPMITKEEFNLVQRMLKKRDNPRPQKQEFNYRGPIRCGECGAKITSEHRSKKQKNGNIHEYTYYHCTKRRTKNCSQKYIEEKELTKQIVKILKDIELPDEFHKWAMIQVIKLAKNEANERNRIIRDNQRIYNGCLKDIDEMIKMKAKNLITDEDYHRNMDCLNQRRNRLRKSSNQADIKIDKQIKEVNSFFDFAEKVRNKFSHGDIQARKEVFMNLCSNLLLKDGKLTIDGPKSLIALSRLSMEVKTTHENVRTSTLPISIKDFEELYSKSPTLLRIVNNVRTEIVKAGDIYIPDIVTQGQI